MAVSQIGAYTAEGDGRDAQEGSDMKLVNLLFEIGMLFFKAQIAGFGVLGEKGSFPVFLFDEKVDDIFLDHFVPAGMPGSESLAVFQGEINQVALR